MPEHTKFQNLVILCKSLEATTKKLEKTELLMNFLKEVNEDEISPSVLLILGRIFAESDSQTLNISASTINRVLNNFEEKTDIQNPLTILDVCQYFSEIALISGSGSRKKKDDLLGEMFSRTDPSESEYIIKMILGEMRHGVADGLMIDAIAKSANATLKLARRAAMFSGDIGELARIAITKGKEGLQEINLQLFTPIEPMLASLATDFKQVFDEHGGQSALEYKYDGARVLIHKKGDQIIIYSRRRSDVTLSLPEIVSLINTEAKVDEAIFDGEVVAVGENEKPLPFQDLMRRFKRIHDIEQIMQGIPVKLYLFDIIYLNGKPLIDTSYEQRWKILSDICSENLLAKRIITNELSEAEKFLSQAMESGHEGIMAKSLSSDYAPGARGKKWFKIKPAETLDLVIIAGEWGHGRRQGWLSNYHLALRDEDSGEYMIVGKTFKGLTDDEFVQMTERIQSLKTNEDDFAVYVRPEIVVEVAYNEIQKSPHYKSGFALRFARIVRIRDDKLPRQTDTLSRLKELYAKQFERKAKADWS